MINSRGHHNCKSSQILIFGGYQKVRESCILELLFEAKPFYTILILGRFYLGMKVIICYIDPNSIEIKTSIPLWCQKETIPVQNWYRRTWKKAIDRVLDCDRRCNIPLGAVQDSITSLVSYYNSFRMSKPAHAQRERMCLQMLAAGNPSGNYLQQKKPRA